MAEKKSSVKIRLKKKQDKFRERLFRLQGLDPVKPSPNDFVAQDIKDLEMLASIVDELGGDVYEIETATVKIQSIQRSRQAKKELCVRKEAKLQEDKELSDAAAKIQSIQRSRKAKKEFQSLKEAKEAKLKEDKELSDAAAKIQTIHRSRKAKKELCVREEAKLQEDKELSDAAAKIQSIHRSRKAKKELLYRKEVKLKEDMELSDAATKEFQLRDVKLKEVQVATNNAKTTPIQALDEDTAASIIQKMYWHWVEEREYQLQVAEAKEKRQNNQKVLQVKERQKSQNDYIRGMLKRQQDKAQRDEMRQRQLSPGPANFKAKPYKRSEIGNNVEKQSVDVPRERERNNFAKDVIKVPSSRVNPVQNSSILTRTTERHRQTLARHEEERFNERLHEMLVIDKKRLKQYESVLDTIENEKSLITRLTSRVDSTMSNSWNVVGDLGALANASYLLETNECDDVFYPNIDENNVSMRLGSALERIKKILAPQDMSPTSSRKPVPHLGAPSDVKRTLHYEKLDRDEYGPVSTSQDLDRQNRLKSYKFSEGEKTEDLKLFNSLDNVCRQAIAEINLYDDVINSMLSNRIKKPITPPHVPVAQSGVRAVSSTNELTEQVAKFLNYPKYEPESKVHNSVGISPRQLLGDDIKYMNPKYLRDSQVNFNNKKERNHVETLQSRQSALENYELQKAQRKQERLNELHDLKLGYSKRIQNDLNRSNNSSGSPTGYAGGGGIARPMQKPSSLRPYKTDVGVSM